MENLVWIDCEMTGLDLNKDALIEVAALVTDAELNVLGEGVDVIITPPPEALANMGDFVTQMHTNSGLLEALSGGMTMAEAQDIVFDYVRTYVLEPDKAPLAGNTISTDRAFLARDMPLLEGYLHYRNVDVSSIKELARRWYPRAFFSAPDKRGNHRALGDIQDSIDELRFYRDTIFVPEPGPGREDARRIAERYVTFSNLAPARSDGD
ncbi:MAG: oligoribonuclease [Propionibacteriaceae bacterium]|jgi:oligoribonuclease|nr:oligoribonuclease [Propionibacteriaceae bacterium]